MVYLFLKVFGSVRLRNGDVQSVGMFIKLRMVSSTVLLYIMRTIDKKLGQLIGYIETRASWVPHKCQIANLKPFYKEAISLSNQFTRETASLSRNA